MVLLKGGERLILEAKASESAILKASGMLTLTNVNLTFEKVEGLISKKKQTLFSVGLSKVHNVGVEGLISKKLVVEISWDGKLKKYVFGIKNANDWASGIQSAIQQG